MTPAQLFGVVVRTIGLLLAVTGGLYLAMGLLMVFWGGIVMLLIGLLVFPVGFWLLKRPEFVVTLAYGEQRPA